MKEEQQTSNVERRTSNVELKPEFQLGECVFSAVAPDERGLVTGIILRPGYVIYLIAWAGSHSNEDQHTALELSREPLYQQSTR